MKVVLPQRATKRLQYSGQHIEIRAVTLTQQKKFQEWAMQGPVTGTGLSIDACYHLLTQNVRFIRSNRENDNVTYELFEIEKKDFMELTPTVVTEEFGEILEEILLISDLISEEELEEQREHERKIKSMTHKEKIAYLAKLKKERENESIQAATV